MKLIVDGYNLIRRSPKYAPLDHRELKLGRDALIADLARYCTLKELDITVVFDGAGARSPTETFERSGGITIVYTRYSQSADDYIIDTAERVGTGAIVVSSDRRVVRESERYGAQSVDSASFEEKMRTALAGAIREEPGVLEADDEDDNRQKGNAHRRSKKDKASRHVLNKL